MDWVSFEIFLNALWLIDFYINLNRVDLIRKIITPKETALAYLHKTMIPDGISLLGSTACILAGYILYAKYFDLIRLIRFRKVLYPIDLFIAYTSGSG